MQHPELPSDFTAQTDFDDMVGSVAVDLTDGSESLQRLALHGGIDLAKWMPVGLNLVWDQGQLHAELLVLEAGRNYEEDAPIPVKKMKVDLPLERILAQMRMLELVVLDRSRDLQRFRLQPGE